MPRMPNIYLEAQYQQRLWTPAVLRPAMWLDASDISTMSVSTGVSEWRDKSRFQQNATQGTAANQPTIANQSFNGKDTLLFDGSNDNMAFDGSFLANTSYFMTFAFARRTTSPRQDCYIIGAASPTAPSNTNLHCGYRSETQLTHAQFGNDLNANVSAYSGTPTLEIFVGRKLIGAGGGTILRQNGTSLASNANTTALSSYPNARICLQDSGVVVYNANVAEIVAGTEARNSALDLLSLQNLEGYYSWKWGIPLAANHPFFSRPPLIGD